MSQDRLAIVMSGGGARAAYQVGLLRVLARRVPTLAPDYLTGVSAGAINAGMLASDESSFDRRIEHLAELWESLTPERVFRVDASSLWVRAGRVLLRVVLGRAGRRVETRGLVDTTPVRELLARHLSPEGIARNLAAGVPRALAVTASGYSTGGSVTWVQGQDIEPWTRAHRRSERAAIGVDHVLASASLPVFFPAVRVGGHWYGDGGMRLTSPLAPAVHLGADRILAISTRYGGADRPQDVESPAYPPPAQVVGTLLNSIFLDQFDADALRLERINSLLDGLPPERHRGMRPIRLLLLRPSRDLGRLANEYEAKLPRTLRFLTRGTGTGETRSNDMLSLIMFQHDYLGHLLALGERDAEARVDEVEAFLAG